MTQRLRTTDKNDDDVGLNWPRIAGALLVILLCGGFWLALASCAVNTLAPAL